MAQWEALLRLDAAFQEQVIQLYERKFPRQIRHYVSAWIENQDWHSASVDDLKAKTSFNSLLNSLEEEWGRCVQDNDILQSPDLPRIKDYLLNHFANDPKSLAAILCECLEEEKKILQQSQLESLKKMSEELGTEIESLERLHEKLGSIHATQDVEDQNNFLKRTKQIALRQIWKIFETASVVLETLTTVDLPDWKRRQQLACLGSPVDTRLDHLQNCFTSLAEVLQQVKRHLTRLSEPNELDRGAGGPLAGMNTVTSLMTKLLTNALVVEKQPVMTSMPSIQQPLVLKTKANFTVGLRFLVNLEEFRCLLKVKAVFDKDVAEKTKSNGFRHFDFAKEPSKVLDVNVTGACLVAEFTDLVLQESKKRARKSDESASTVTEELHVIAFVTRFQHAGLDCHIQASTLPVVVISATGQLPSAWASVMWYNMSAGGPTNLSLFSDPPRLSWPELSQVLSWQFLSVGKRRLDDNQLSMLREKFVEHPDGFVHWNSFSKGGCQKNVNVWVWLYGILDLIKKHLADLWRDGLIMGFVSREQIKKLLWGKKTGTFLLRFSETNQDGAISFSWVDHHNGETQVHSIEPYTKSELEKTPMPDAIYDFNPRVHGDVARNPLLYLYPDVDKDVAFGRYYSSSDKQTLPRGWGYLPRRPINVADMPTPPPSPPQVQPHGQRVPLDAQLP
ncbi:signal transducer and activator of transcription 1-alpha/beta-like [Hippocampus zosterae]|uniref:signal transducer and activator of transcription 1-alpha/beta-like n=1 Tax=Hippocampus zosterae TaxID=109293 RepID=UPI00223DE6CE|nr:signal transducer and activator of transcription 1-alpha/beta-like [Hippocampus zosterae]